MDLLVSCTHDWGDKALQECNLSTQFVRCLQEKQTPGSAQRDRALFQCYCKHGPKRKTHLICRAQRAASLGGRGAGLFVAGLSAQDGPDKAAELARDGDFSLVALKAPAQEFHKAQVQAILSLPTQSADLLGLAFLSAGKLLTDFGRQSVMLGALAE